MFFTLYLGVFEGGTFQVVLVSNVHRSFILINYGDIAETEQKWLVSDDRPFVNFVNEINDKNCPRLASYFIFYQKAVVSRTS